MKLEEALLIGSMLRAWEQV